MKEAANSSDLSFDNERDSCSQNDQRIYASDHDAEINVGHNALRMEPDLVVGHRTSTRGVFPPKTSRANRDSVPAKKYKSAFRVRAAYLGGCSSIQRKRPSGGNAEAVRGCMPGAARHHWGIPGAIKCSPKWSVASRVTKERSSPGGLFNL